MDIQPKNGMEAQAMYHQPKHGMEAQAIYQQYYDDCGKAAGQTASVCSRISFWRGIAFLAAVILLCYGYVHANPAFYTGTAACLTAFLLLVRRHQALSVRQRFFSDQKAAAGDYLARFNDNWKHFSINGAQYLTEDCREARDLDIFGKNSLYQYICTASTIWGQDRLADWLNHPAGQVREIKERQQAVSELAKKPSFTMNFEAAARILRDMPYREAQRTFDRFFQTLDQQNSPNTVRRVLTWIVPITTLLLFFLFLLGIHRQSALSGFFLCAGVQLLSAFLCYSKNNRLLTPVYQLNRTITPYRKLIGYLEQESFDSPYLRNLQKDLTRKGPASAALKKLESITNAVSTRHNLSAFLLYNSLFLYDFHCIERYAAWTETYKDEIRNWLEVIGKTEALISLGVISHTKQSHVLPEVIEPPQTAHPLPAADPAADNMAAPQTKNSVPDAKDQNMPLPVPDAKDRNIPLPVLDAKDLRHPLISEATVVGNDLTLRHRTCIITGSNMSGKTTFMRSIGVNLVLAYAGGFCTAQHLRISLMELCTSMRTEDNVNEGISTFYAELLRIKRMIEISRKQQPMIALIDEIYKGTNSRDRIFAAKETVRNLSRPYAFTILTTHDFELCDLESDETTDAENYYFTEHFKQDKIVFDYKMRKGRCTTTNARYLLRMAGIL